MKLLTVKIERRFLYLAETETRGKCVVIKSARSFPLPEGPEGGDSAEDPETLARFIDEAIKRGRLAPAPVALLFHSGFAPHHEYYHQKMSASEERGRAGAEAEFFRPSDLGRHIFETERYSHGNDSDGRTSAVFAVKDEFLRGLIKSLKSFGIKTRFASSALAVWSDLMRKLLNALLKRDVRFGFSPLCLDVGEDSVRCLFFVNARLVHRRETPIPEGLSDDELLQCIAEETQEIILHVGNKEGDADIKPDCILLSGECASAPNFADRVAGRLNVPCRTPGFYMDQLCDTVSLGGELVDRQTLYGRIVSLAGAIPGKQKKKNLLYGGFRKRRESGIARAAAVFFTLATLAAMSAMPLANAYLKWDNAENLAIIERPIYAEAREKLAAQRQLNALLQNHMAEEAYMQSKNLKYGALLYQISRGLLANARIERVVHEDTGAGMDVTFTTADPDSFLELKEKMNEEGNLTVEDPVVMNKAGDALWRCEITISWDLPAMEEVSE
jgi:hypothetical protein